MVTCLRGSAPYLEMDRQFGVSRIDYLLLNLPFQCNYRCLKCCNQAREIPAKAFSHFLSLEEIKQLIYEARQLGAWVLVIAGEGEPFLDKRIWKIIEIADLAGLIPYIFTNGSLLTREILEFLRKKEATLIINMDSLIGVKYDMLAEKEGAFRQLLQNLKLCREIFKNTKEVRSSTTILRLAINTVVTRVNYTEVENIRKFCGDDFVFVCNEPITIGSALVNADELLGTPEEQLKIQKIIQRMSADNGPLGSTSDRKWCAYMRYGISVGADGEILTCPYALETAGLIGNVRSHGLSYYVGWAVRQAERFYTRFGHQRCILRHPQYSDFIKQTGLDTLFL